MQQGRKCHLNTQVLSVILYIFDFPGDKTLHTDSGCAVSNALKTFKHAPPKKFNVTYLSTVQIPDVGIASRRHW